MRLIGTAFAVLAAYLLIQLAIVIATGLALVLRSVIRKAGHGPLEEHWPGTPAGLAVIQRLTGRGPAGQLLTRNNSRG